MHDFEYVPTEEWKPVRDELLQIILRLQNEVNDSFTSFCRQQQTQDDNS